MRFNLPRLIGITGKAGVGKDTFADYLVRQHGYVKYSLAEPIKRGINATFGFTPEQWNDRKWKEEPNPVLCGKSPREAAQFFGTEGGREFYGEDVWVNMMADHWKRLWAEYEVECRANDDVRYWPPRPRMVVPDVRFDNEAARIAAMGGVVMRVIRPGVEPVNDHLSERGVSDKHVHVEVINDSDIVTFLRRCVYALEDYLDRS